MDLAEFIKEVGGGLAGVVIIVQGWFNWIGVDDVTALRRHLIGALRKVSGGGARTAMALTSRQLFIVLSRAFLIAFLQICHQRVDPWET